MAERVAPPGEKPKDDDSPPSDEPAAFASGTYVVQVPREQIYRFPTPENAKLAEKYSNPATRKRPGLAFLTRICGVILFVAVILALIAALIYFIVHPGPPKFTVDSVNARKQAHHKHRASHQNHHKFYVRLTAENTHSGMEISYLKGGTASLVYKLEEIGSGEPETISSSKRATIFNVSLEDSKALLPQKIRKSMNGKGPKDGLPLSLSVILPMKIKVIGMSLWFTKVVGDCHLKVSNFTENARVLSQSCQVRFA